MAIKTTVKAISPICSGKSVSLDPACPLIQGLQSAIVGGQKRDLVSNIPFKPIASYGGRYGLGFNVSSAATSFQTSLNPAAFSDKVTVVSVVSLRSAGNYPMIYSTDGFDLRFDSSTGKPSFYVKYSSAAIYSSNITGTGFRTIAGIYDGINSRVYLDNYGSTASTSTSGNIPSISSTPRVGARPNEEYPIDGIIPIVLVWNRALQPSELDSVLRNPWQVVLQPRRAVFALSEATGNNAYSLSCASGTLVLTGSSATLTKGSNLSASSGAIALTGSAATLAKGSIVSASGGALALSGSAATLTYTQPGGYALSLDSGAITATGGTGTLIHGSLIAASGGSVTLTGSSSTLTKGSKLTAASGGLSLTGGLATLDKGSKLTASSASLSLTGNQATLTYTQAGHYQLSLDHGSFTLGAGSVTLLASRLLSAASGGLTLTGGAATFLYGKGLSLSHGDLALTGYSASLHRGAQLAMGSGALALTGGQADLIYGEAMSYRLACAGGSLVLKGWEEAFESAVLAARPTTVSLQRCL